MIPLHCTYFSIFLTFEEQSSQYCALIKSLLSQIKFVTRECVRRIERHRAALSVLKLDNYDENRSIQ